MKIDFLRLYEELFKVLPTGNVQQLMEVSSEITGNPILTVDVMYQAYGIAPRQKIGDRNWDYLLENGKLDTEMTVQLYEEGVMQSANGKTTPYVIDWGHGNEELPKIVAVIKVNDVVEGYTVMQCAREQITEDQMRAMEIIRDALTLFFQENIMEYSEFDTYQRLFLAELFGQSIKNQRQLQLWFRNLGFKLQPPYRIFAIKADNRKERNVLSYIRKTLHHNYPYQLALIREDVLYVLEYRRKMNREPGVTRAQFEQLLLRFGARCGISNTYTELLDTADYLTQAREVIDLGRQFGPDGRIHYYRDYYIPAILAPRIRDMTPANYLAPAIPALESYDREHDSDFLATLKVYVQNLGNTGASAKELHIHRNTMLYRLAKIEELTGISLKDYETILHLMLSFYMMEQGQQEFTASDPFIQKGEQA